MTPEERKALWYEAIRLLDRAQALLLELRAKHEAEVVRRAADVVAGRDVQLQA